MLSRFVGLLAFLPRRIPVLATGDIQQANETFEITLPHLGSPSFGIVVPLELEGLRILKQEVQPDGPIRVEEMLYKQRFRCLRCHKASTERILRVAETRTQRCGCARRSACWPARATSRMWRASTRLAHTSCKGVWRRLASIQLASRVLSLEESGPLPTLRFLGMDEFARRKGHRHTRFCAIWRPTRCWKRMPGAKKAEDPPMPSLLTQPGRPDC